jgi:hypothetical protein
MINKSHHTQRSQSEHKNEVSLRIFCREHTSKVLMKTSSWESHENVFLEGFHMKTSSMEEDFHGLPFSYEKGKCALHGALPTNVKPNMPGNPRHFGRTRQVCLYFVWACYPTRTKEVL